mmetsp:Transcript_58128/g.173486  ORF Transcript_58128/g.173486 Transcript_58128/m.173486 type:complete len:244 (+) Transcript_58128:1909-2640(+)
MLPSASSSSCPPSAASLWPALPLAFLADAGFSGGGDGSRWTGVKPSSSAMSFHLSALGVLLFFDPGGRPRPFFLGVDVGLGALVEALVAMHFAAAFGLLSSPCSSPLSSGEGLLTAPSPPPAPAARGENSGRSPLSFLSALIAPTMSTLGEAGTEEVPTPSPSFGCSSGSGANGNGTRRDEAGSSSSVEWWISRARAKSSSQSRPGGDGPLFDIMGNPLVKIRAVPWGRASCDLTLFHLSCYR